MPLALTVSADDWGAPQIRERFSPSRESLVRVVPGSSWGDTVGFKSAPKGPYAKAEFYRRDATRSYRFLKETTMLNGGSVIHAYALNELFSPGEIAKFSRSVSSIWWHKAFTNPRDHQTPLMKGQKDFCVTTGIKNRDLDFDLETGNYKYRDTGYCAPY